MTFPVQQQPDLIQADELTLSNIIDRLRTLDPGQAIEYTQQRVQEFPTSGRYEPAYHAEAMACGVRLAAELHTAVLRAYYDLVRKVEGSLIDRMIAENAGALALLPLHKLVSWSNLHAEKVDGMLSLPVLDIDTRITVQSPSWAGGNIVYQVRGGVLVRRKN